jgi:BASS family bile acid:Na+ symporter
MTLSTVSITNRDLASIKSSPRPILISLLLNYVVMGGIMLLMARWLVNDSEIWAGFVTLAAMPPAISATPFSYMLGGDTVFPLFGTTGLYLVALGLTPGIMILLLGADFVNPTRLLLILVQLIVIPLAVSRLLLSRGLAQNVIKWRDTAINWTLFTTIYIIVGLNRQVFFEHPGILFWVIMITIALTFGLGHAIDFIARRLNIDRSTRISWIVMGTRKNTGLASVIALAFLGERATIPAAVLAIFAVLFIVWMGFYFKETGQVNL